MANYDFPPYTLFPPAIFRQGDHPTKSTTRGFYVTMSQQSDESTFRHEVWHVWQFWFLITVGIFLTNLMPFWVKLNPVLYYALPVLPVLIFEYVPQLNYRKEASAYARSVRYGRDLSDAAAALCMSMGYKRSSDYQKAKEEIQARLEKRFGLFYPLF